MKNKIIYSTVKGILIVLTIFSVAGNAMAQNVDNDETGNNLMKPRILWKISPFHFFDNTLKFSSEFYNAERIVSFEAGAGISTNSGYFAYDGGDITLTIKKYILPFTLKNSKKGNEYLRSVYLGFDLRGGYYNGYGSDMILIDKQNNESEWIWQNIDHTVMLVQPGFRIGLQQSFWDVLFLEIFLGGGLRLTDIDTDNPTYDPERSDNFDLSDKAYEGVVPNVGFDICIPLK